MKCKNQLVLNEIQGQKFFLDTYTHGTLQLKPLPKRTNKHRNVCYYTYLMLNICKQERHPFILNTLNKH